MSFLLYWHLSLRPLWSTVLVCGLFLNLGFGQAENGGIGVQITELRAKVEALPETDTSAKLKKAALRLALEQADNGVEANDLTYTSSLVKDVEGALPKDLGHAGTPPAELSFLCPLKQTEDNPYLTSLYTWAEAELAKPDLAWKKCTPKFNVFKAIYHDYGTREEANKTNTLLWLVAHPQSKYQGNPELFLRMLRRTHAYADAYDVHAQKYSDSVNDFFAVGPALYEFMAIDRLWPDLILPSQRAQWDRVIKKAASFWLQTYDSTQDGYSRMGHYTNRDLGVANILLNCGLYLKDQHCLDLAKGLVDAQEAILYPDGGFAYIGTQNESCGYHDDDIEFLARYYLLTGDQKAKEFLVRSEWYGVLSMEPARVAEFWTTPSWKHTWNGSVSTGTEVVAGLTGNPYLRTILNQEIKAKGTEVDLADVTLNAIFYRGDVVGKTLPDGYTILDRNIQGPRGRYGRFSYAATTRVANPDEPGKDTLMGAMILDAQPTSDYPLNAALMRAMPRVLTKLSTKALLGEVKDADGTEKREWAGLTGDEISSCLTGRNYAAVSSQYTLLSFGSSQRGDPTPWVATQQWIGLGDRIVGVLEVAPNKGSQSAAAVTVDLLFGVGGTSGGPPQEMQVVDDQNYRFGDLAITVHETNFPARQLSPTMFRTKKATELLLQDEAGNPDQIGAKIKTFSSDKPYYCVVEIRPFAEPGALEVQRLTTAQGLRGLSVKLGGKVLTLWHNPTEESASVTFTADQLGTGTNTLHSLSANRDFVVTALPASGTTEVPSHGEILAVSSPDPDDHLPGWGSIAEMLGAQAVAPKPKPPATDSSVTGATK